jgi:hypothetical protein
MLHHARMIMERENITDPLQFNHWTEVSALMKGKRTYRECARHWKFFSPQIERARKNKWTIDHYKDLLFRMIQCFGHANDESEVVWKSIVTLRDPFPVDTYRERWVYLKTQIQKTYDLSDYSFKGLHV